MKATTFITPNTYPEIQATDIEIGEGTVIEESVVIRGVSGPAKRIKIGDHCYIGENVQIICDDFELGDYSKIHHDTNVHGYKPCKIGHNAWIGQFSIIDSIGGTSIGNNCGIGAHSQLWSHIKYGDTLEGCRFLSENPLTVGNDVWFVGHCIVSPIIAEDKSMAMVGSVVTKKMEYNQIYAGSPAKSLSEKIGCQFQEVSIDEKVERMNQYIKEAGVEESIRIVTSMYEMNLDDDFTYFDVASRTYTKKRSAAEVKFMKFLLPEKGKFVPYG
jgi:acetyltransferase-like isoleucine patch superfamily enzyme